MSQIQVGDTVEISDGRNKSLFQIRSIEPNKIIISPDDDPSIFNGLVFIDDEWKVMGAEYKIYKILFIPKKSKIDWKNYDLEDLPTNDWLIWERIFRSVDFQDLLKLISEEDFPSIINQIGETALTNKLRDETSNNVFKMYKYINKLGVPHFKLLELFNLVKNPNFLDPSEVLNYIISKIDANKIIPFIDLLNLKAHEIYPMARYTAVSGKYDFMEKLISYGRERNLKDFDANHINKLYAIVVGKGNPDYLDIFQPRHDSYGQYDWGYYSHESPRFYAHGGFYNELSKYKIEYYDFPKVFMYAVQNGRVNVMKELYRVQNERINWNEIFDLALIKSLLFSQVKSLEWVLNNSKLTLPENAADLSLRGPSGIDSEDFEKSENYDQFEHPTEERKIEMLNYLYHQSLIPQNILDKNGYLQDQISEEPKVLNWLYRHNLLIPTRKQLNNIEFEIEKIKAEKYVFSMDEFDKRREIVNWYHQHGIY